jgi:hypothetical protein
MMAEARTGVIIRTGVLTKRKKRHNDKENEDRHYKN